MDEPNYKELYEKSIIEINELKEHLKKYTAPKRSKSYYENNKDKINEEIQRQKLKESAHAWLMAIVILFGVLYFFFNSSNFSLCILLSINICSIN